MNNNEKSDFDNQDDIDFQELCKNGLRLVDILGITRVAVNPQTIATMQPFEQI